MPKDPRQSNVLLDEQAKKDARAIAEHYNLRGVSTAIRFALRDLARRIEEEKHGGLSGGR
jgi:antitoxin component of RelBE/YafQ-DinJ toxin-antitoxin module